MFKQRVYLIFSGFLFLNSCNLKSLAPDSYIFAVRDSFTVESVTRRSTDTIRIVTCSDFVYFPFGNGQDTTLLKSDLLKQFVITSNKIKTTAVQRSSTDSSDVYILRYQTIEMSFSNSNLSIFLDNDPEASMHGYLRGGYVVDEQVFLVGGIRVGMRAEDFLSAFFIRFPAEWSANSVIELESCVMDIIHVYSFENGNLKSIRFLNQ